MQIQTRQGMDSKAILDADEATKSLNYGCRSPEVCHAAYRDSRRRVTARDD